MTVIGVGQHGKIGTRATPREQRIVTLGSSKRIQPLPQDETEKIPAAQPVAKPVVRHQTENANAIIVICSVDISLGRINKAQSGCNRESALSGRYGNETSTHLVTASRYSSVQQSPTVVGSHYAVGSPGTNTKSVSHRRIVCNSPIAKVV